MFSLYIYFKVGEANAQSAREAVKTLLSDIRQAGVSAEFWRRAASAADGTQTWMTVFHDVDSDFEAQVQSLFAQRSLSQVIGPLNIERFVRC